MASSSRPKAYNKRNRNVLSIETKIEIITRLGEGETVSSLARMFSVGKATVSDIKSNKDIILSFASKLDSENGSKKRKTMKNAKDLKLEEALYIWFMQRRNKGEPISGYLLCEKALQFNNQLDGSPDFKASQGWLRNFKSRHSIQELDIQGESLSSDATTAENFKETFWASLEEEGYSLDDVYNARETGLYWKSLPPKSLASQCEAAAPGFKKCKERVTILVAANASGSHRLPVLMIGEAKKPHCLKNMTCLPLCYKAQKRAWMNSEIFLDWYTNQFIPNVKRLREQENITGKVILLLDNTPSHPEMDTLNAVDANFKVIFLPPSETALIQPMDQGIIGKLKKMYKKQVLCRLLLAENENVVTFLKKLNLEDCCYMLADAWTTLSQNNLNEAWNRLLGKKGGNESTAVDTNDYCINEVVELFQTVPGFSDCDKDDVHMWLEDGNDSGFQFLSDEEIVSFVQEENQIHVLTDDEDSSDVHDVLVDYEENPKRRPSPEEAFIALETAMAWYEQEDDCCPTQLMLLKTIHDLAAKRRLSSL